MQQNIGSKDAFIRFVIALLMLIIGHYVILSISEAVGIIINILALVVLVSGYFRYCFLYTVFGKSTA